MKPENRMAFNFTKSSFVHKKPLEGDVNTVPAIYIPVL